MAARAIIPRMTTMWARLIALHGIPPLRGALPTTTSPTVRILTNAVRGGLVSP